MSETLRSLGWKDFCLGLESDNPSPLQKLAEAHFFSKIAPDALHAFFDKVNELLQLYEASLHVPGFRTAALAKTEELFSESLPFFEQMHPVLTSRGIDPETANYLTVCAYLK